jgi:hypothetical protein
VYLNNVNVGSVFLADCGYCDSDQTVTGAFNFSDIAPVSGGYQVDLILQNTVPGGEGSVAWLDGGLTGLSYDTGVPEPGSMLLLGSGVLFAGLVRRKLRNKCVCPLFPALPPPARIGLRLPKT